MRTSEPRKGQYCLWGKIQYAEKLVDGVWSVGTAGHGGIKLDRKHNKAVPEYLRRSGGWYEEDCGWAIPFVLFRDELQNLPKYDYNQAVQCFKSWFPTGYEKWSDTIIPPGESYIKDKQDFQQKHKNDWIVVSAINIGNNNVSVVATQGGSYDYDAKKRQFVVPSDEYNERGRFGFVVDVHKHVEKISA